MANETIAQSTSMEETGKKISVHGITEQEHKTAIKVLKAVQDRIGTTIKSPSEKARESGTKLGMSASVINAMVKDAEKNDKDTDIVNLMAHNTCLNAQRLLGGIKLK